ncbi:MAG: WD40 repeat domain-containing protein [Methanoregula sp.]|nr:WD40 repeat domain-containing protein [Methanoregula sp.]
MAVSPAFALEEPMIYSDPVLVSVSGNGQYFIAGSERGAINFFDKTGTLLWAYPTGKRITGVSTSHTGNYIVINGVDPIDASNGTLYCFNPHGELLWQSDPAMGIQQARISSDGTTIIAAGYTGSPEAREPVMYSLDQTGNVRWKILKMTGGVSSVALSEDGNTIVVGTWGGGGSQDRYDGSVRLFSVNGTMLGKYGTKSWVIGVDISRDGSSIAAIDRDAVYFLNRDGNLLWNYSSRYQTRSVAISGNGNFVAAGSQYKVYYFNRTGSLLWDLTDSGYVYSVALSDDGTSVLAGTAPGGNYQKNGTVYSLNRDGLIRWSFPITGAARSVSTSGSGDVNLVGLWGARGEKDPSIYVSYQPGKERKIILNAGYYLSPQARPTPYQSLSQTQQTTTSQPAPLTMTIIFFALILSGCAFTILKKIRQL